LAWIIWGAGGRGGGAEGPGGGKRGFRGRRRSGALQVPGARLPPRPSPLCPHLVQQRVLEVPKRAELRGAGGGGGLGGGEQRVRAFRGARLVLRLPAAGAAPRAGAPRAAARRRPRRPTLSSGSDSLMTTPPPRGWYWHVPAHLPGGGGAGRRGARLAWEACLLWQGAARRPRRPPRARFHAVRPCRRSSPLSTRPPPPPPPLLPLTASCASSSTPPRPPPARR
jgi:hypothetical protein